MDPQYIRILYVKNECMHLNIIYEDILEILYNIVYTVHRFMIRVCEINDVITKKMKVFVINTS